MQSNQLLLKPLASSSYSELLGWLEVQIYIKQKQHKSWHQRFNAVNQMDLWTGCHPKIAWPCFQRCRIYKNMCRSLGGEPNLLQNFNQNLCHYQLKISQKTERGFESFLLLTIIIFTCIHIQSRHAEWARYICIYLYIVLSKHVSKDLMFVFLHYFSQKKQGAKISGLIICSTSAACEAGDSKAWNK